MKKSSNLRVSPPNEVEPEPDQSAQYMLRRAIPLWNPLTTIRQTLAFCERTGIREVIWKVDVHSFNQGFTALARIRRYFPWLKEARRRSRRQGIIFSINPWISRGHLDAGRYPNGPPPGFRWHVRPNGAEASERACPLSPGWRRWLIDAYGLYATTHPDKLWVEDDFRTFAGPATEIGCFCPVHLKAFSRRIGERLTREELVRRLTRPGVPDPIRGRWFDFQGEAMVELARHLARRVHQESPETRLGLMNSWSTDGRWWRDAVLALAGPHRPLARPSLGPYVETRNMEFIADHSTDHLKEVACLPPQTEICPELENMPHTAFAKSSRMTRMQLALSQARGYRGITMNLFDFVGNSTDEDPRLEQMLVEVKPLLDRMAAIDGVPGQTRGVAIPFPVRYADRVHVEAPQGFEAFEFSGEGWFPALQGSGIPAVFNGQGPVYAVTGQSARALSHAQIRRMLRGGMLLDGSAAAVLEELGFGACLGVNVGWRLGHRKAGIDAERENGWTLSPRESPVYMPLDFLTDPWPGRVYSLRSKKRAKVVSHFVDPDHRAVMPGMTLFESDEGGRVAVYPFDLSSGIGAGFMNWRRKNQLQRVVRWLGRDIVDLEVTSGAWMVPIRRDYPGYTVITLLNFELDDWPEVAFSFRWPGNARKIQVQRLVDDGRLEPAQPTVLERQGKNLWVRFDRGLPKLDFTIFRIA